MKSRLYSVENTIKAIFEGDSSLFPWVDDQSALLHKLLESIQEHVANLGTERKDLPTKFFIYLNGEDRRIIEHQNNLLEALQNFILETGIEFGLSNHGNVEIELVTRNSLMKNEIQIRSVASEPISGETGVVPVVLGSVQKNEEKQNSSGFLILEDESLFELKKPVTNIGRNSSNHLTINDLRISRTHAQIRSVIDDFILFDIGSSRGTYVNGERVTQRKLKPGDVISLAGIKLIFTQEQSNSPDVLTETQPGTKPMSTPGDVLC